MNRSRSRESHQQSHSHSRESRRRWDRSPSHKYADRGSNSPEEQRPHNAAMDAISRALRKASRLPYSSEIERA